MANNITLSSMFESQKQTLETQLQGLALPRDAEKIQSVVTNYLNGIFDDQGEFRQNLTQSEDYILQAALSLLNAQQEISKAFAQAKPKKVSVPATNPFEKPKEEPMIEQNSASTFVHIQGFRRINNTDKTFFNGIKEGAVPLSCLYAGQAHSYAFYSKPVFRT